ncbi:MAG TPA: hypothetical protein VHS29_14235 [Candidatus Acidoferrales bacterium]|nr:hypothetical protein [Candidatus Acidoferrales bacterium]
MKCSKARDHTNSLSLLLQKIALLIFIFPWLHGVSARATELKPETAAAFDRYVRITESKMESNLQNNRFLVVDQLPDAQCKAAYEQLHRGQLFIQEMNTQDGHLTIRIPNGLIHHWVGVTFIPKATLRDVNAVLQDYANEPKIYQPEIRRAKLIEQNGNKSKVYLQFFSKSIITIVLDGYFDVTLTTIDKTRSESISHSTRVVEVVNPGSADEHERTDGGDHGYMWRLNSYWRIEEKDGGVYVQNESITLTRTVPVMLAWIANPLIKSLPRDVLAHMLNDTQDAVRKKSRSSMTAPLEEKGH